MPNIKPISDLRNYNEVLRDVSVGEPVFLTKNGRGRYAVVDIEEYEKTAAGIKLLAELSRGVRSGKEQGWQTMNEVYAKLATAEEQHEAEIGRSLAEILKETSEKYGL